MPVEDANICSCYFCFRNARTLFASMLSEDALIMPCKGVLKLCAMSLPVSLPTNYSLFSFGQKNRVFFPSNNWGTAGLVEESSQP